MTARRVVCLALLAVGLLAPLGFALAALPDWWSLIAAEMTPMTWLESVVLVIAGVAALATWYVLRLAGRTNAVWLVLALGFAALALDERFAIHERVRDSILAPRDISIPFLPWIAPGDFLVLLIALAGLALLPFAWRALAPDRTARILFVTGGGLAAIAVGMDSIDPATFTVQGERLEQTLEEVVELLAFLALLAAIALRLLTALDQLAANGRNSSQSTPATSGES